MESKQYAKYNNIIWEVWDDIADPDTYDLNIDDEQGDMLLCFVPKQEVIFVSEAEYLKRIKELNASNTRQDNTDNQ